MATPCPSCFGQPVCRSGFPLGRVARCAVDIEMLKHSKVKTAAEAPLTPSMLLGEKATQRQKIGYTLREVVSGGTVVIDHAAHP